MLAKVAAFEIRYQLRNPILWVAALFVFGMAFGSMSFDLVDAGAIPTNSTYPVLYKYLAFSVMFMFVATAFVANVVIRDDETGFGPILRSTRIGKADYLVGRFAGAFAVAALCLLLIPVGMLLGSLVPWPEAPPMGPNRLSDHLYGYFVLALPNVLVTSAILFSLATMTRSMMATYLGVVGLVIFYLALDTAYHGRTDLAAWVSIAEPFAKRAFNDWADFVTLAERASLLPPLEGALLHNRLVWTGVSLLFLGAAWSRYRFTDRPMSRRERRREALQRAAETPAPAFAPALRLPTARHDAAAAWAILWARAKFEARQVFVSPAFVLLMIWAIFTVLLVLTSQRDPDGRPSYPTTVSMIPELEQGLFIIPAIIVIIYAGELVWSERSRRIHEIIDATGLPNWAYVVPKTAAIGLVLLAIFTISALASVGVQLALGFTRLELDLYLTWYILPETFDMLLLAAMAVFLQAMSPHKVIGWGIVVLYLVAQIVQLAPEHNLLNFGGTPPVPLNDVAGADNFWVGAWVFRLYWGALAVLLLVAAHLLWRRGTETRLMPRLRLAPRRLRGKAGLVAGAALLTFAGSGAYAYWNTNVLNDYRGQEAGEARLAEFERRFMKYAGLPQPSVVDAKLEVALYPEERRAVTEGRYLLRNESARPIRDIHLRRGAEGLELVDVRIAGARPVLADEDYGYRIHRLDRPMLPGETRAMTFRTNLHRRGFANGQPDMRLLENGTWLTGSDLTPSFGPEGAATLQDPEARKKHGLAPPPRPARLEDPAGAAVPTFPGGWMKLDLTVSTSADQTPVGPGRVLSDETRDGRRTVRFVPDAPVRNSFSVQSGRFAEKRRRHQGIDLAVYYHPGHEWNVDRMLDALQASIDYGQEAFGPYPFREARIVEVPGYLYAARAFAGTIGYSESLGFVADLTDSETVDNVTLVTAHELGHQYWGHQLHGAKGEGGPVLFETLASYTGLMVLRRVHGEDQARRQLRRARLDYLYGREGGGEPPLARAGNQGYLHSGKGSIAMYLLQERMGEAAVNRALKALLDRYRFKGAPYPRTSDLIAALRAEARTAEQQALITDLFERVTFYDLEAGEPKAVRRADGKWEVSVPVVARKYYEGRGGDETEAPLAEAIEIGLFTAPPGPGAFCRPDVILVERRPLRSGRQVVTFVVDRKPTHVGIDPFNLYMDRDGLDNVLPVG